MAPLGYVAQSYHRCQVPGNAGERRVNPARLPRVWGCLFLLEAPDTFRQKQVTCFPRYPSDRDTSG